MNVIGAIAVRVALFFGVVGAILGVLETQELHGRALFSLLIVVFTALYCAVEMRWDRRPQ